MRIPAVEVLRDLNAVLTYVLARCSEVGPLPPFRCAEWSPSPFRGGFALTGRTLFEFWFVTHDGRTHLPSAGQNHEAIYCATVGTSAREQEDSGRCLPD